MTIPLDQLVLLGGILVLFAVASNKFSARLGVPALVVFIALGMLAGSEGVGGIHFENYALANGIGTVALALILFDGGLRTSATALQLAWKPALALATVGVLITSIVTGLAATWILGISLLEGILLGSIVGSTDAAAVFAVLRGRGTRLPDRLGAALEVESGSNDPMAVFLTIGLLEILVGGVEPGWRQLWQFVYQMGLGLFVGLAVGRVGAELNRRINLDAAGLYPVMMAATGLLAYGLAAAPGASGFLAIYVSGIVMGNRDIVFKRGIFLFSDGMAWAAQIVMFTMLGLLSFPRQLLEVSAGGIAVAGVLILLARPVAVFALLPVFRFTVREMALVAWGGLRGAVPIILATYPLLSGVARGQLLFDVVFFVVLVSAVTQGWTLPHVAGALGLQLPARPQPPVSLEITSLRHVRGDIVDYLVEERARVEKRRIRDLALPEGAVVALVARGEDLIPPRGSTRLLRGDHVFLVVRPELREVVDRIFVVRGREDERPLPDIEFPVSARMRVADLGEFYGVELDFPVDDTLEDVLRARYPGGRLEPGTRVELGGVSLSVLETSSEGVEVVGLRIHQKKPRAVD